MATEVQGNGAPGLADRYAAAFSAYLRERGERGLGAAYDLGREAVAAHLSVLDLAEAHHAALLSALAEAPPADARAVLGAAADFLRESLSIFESVHRGYHEVQEVARVEHQHVEQLRSLAEASVGINASLTVEEILQRTAEAARAAIGAARATLVVHSRDPRLRPLAATSPTRRVVGVGVGVGGDGDGDGDGEAARPAAARLVTRLIGRGGELGTLEVVDDAPREFTARDEAILTQLAQVASVAIVNAKLYDRERTIAQTLQRSLRPGALPHVQGLGAAVRFRPAGEGVELGGDFYDLFRAGDGGWAALIGDVQGKGPEAAAVTALARHTLRAAAHYEASPSAVLCHLHQALHEAAHTGGRFCTVAYAHLHVLDGRVRLELACGGHPLPLVLQPDGSVQPVGRLGTLLGTDIAPQLTDVTVDLGPGEMLVLYTDGVTEVRRRRREVFGHRELTALLSDCAGLPPEAVADRVESAVLAASQGALRDDVAILVFGPTARPAGVPGILAGAGATPPSPPHAKDIDG